MEHEDHWTKMRSAQLARTKTVNALISLGLLAGMVTVPAGVVAVWRYTWDYATRVLQWDLVDRSIHLRKANALQPKRSRGDGQPVRQHHFGANYSTLLVFSTGKVRRCDS